MAEQKISKSGKCTWEGCDRTAVCPQIGSDKAVWANLCTRHDAELSRAISDSKPPTMMAAYVKAQGGSRAAADRHMAALRKSPTFQNLMEILFPEKSK